jgi:hypothetical protein
MMGGRSRRTLDVPLSWAQPDSVSDPSRKSFYGAARLNVAVGGTPNYMRPAAAFPLDEIDRSNSELVRDGDLLLGIEITAEDSAPMVGWFHLKWWSHVMLKDKDGKDVYYMLNDAQITFEAADREAGDGPVA